MRKQAHSKDDDNSDSYLNPLGCGAGLYHACLRNKIWQKARLETKMNSCFLCAKARQNKELFERG